MNTESFDKNNINTDNVITDTDCITEDEWLKYRRQGIGGSDAAAVLCVSPYMTARDLYYDKLGIVSCKDNNANWVGKKIGHLLEDLVAEIFKAKTGYNVYQIKKMFCSQENKFMLADVDYFTELPDGKTAILEIKTTNYNAKDNWWRDGNESVPVNYEIQGRHYMAVMDLDTVFYCCLYGNNEDEVIIRSLNRDMEYEHELIELERNFWDNHVIPHNPPPYTESGEMVLQSVKKHFGAADKEAPQIELTKPLASCVARFLELQAQKKETDAKSAKLENEMKRMQGYIVSEMGKSCTAVCTVNDNSYTVTYNPSVKATITKDNLMKLRAQHPDIYSEYVTMSESRRFYVKNSKNTAA